MLQPGIKGHHEQTVTPAMSAARVGSGLVDVFATPMLVALVEQTCYEKCLNCLPGSLDGSTVGVLWQYHGSTVAVPWVLFFSTSVQPQYCHGTETVLAGRDSAAVFF